MDGGERMSRRDGRCVDGAVDEYVDGDVDGDVGESEVRALGGRAWVYEHLTGWIWTDLDAWEYESLRPVWVGYGLSLIHI